MSWWNSGTDNGGIANESWVMRWSRSWGGKEEKREAHWANPCHSEGLEEGRWLVHQSSPWSPEWYVVWVLGPRISYFIWSGVFNEMSCIHTGSRRMMEVGFTSRLNCHNILWNLKNRSRWTRYGSLQSLKILCVFEAKNIKIDIYDSKLFISKIRHLCRICNHRILYLPCPKKIVYQNVAWFII